MSYVSLIEIHYLPNTKERCFKNLFTNYRNKFRPDLPWNSIIYRIRYNSKLQHPFTVLDYCVLLCYCQCYVVLKDVQHRVVRSVLASRGFSQNWDLCVSKRMEFSISRFERMKLFSMIVVGYQLRMNSFRVGKMNWTEWRDRYWRSVIWKIGSLKYQFNRGDIYARLLSQSNFGPIL